MSLQEVDDAFTLIQAHLARYDVWATRYTENNEYSAEDALTHESSLTLFIKSLAKYRNQESNIGDLPSTVTIGVIQVGLGPMKEAIAPTPLHCLDAISARLPVLASERNNILVGEVSVATAPGPSSPIYLTPLTHVFDSAHTYRRD